MANFIEFGPFRLNFKERILLRHGKQVTLMPKTIDLLILLATHDHQVIALDFLLEKLWPDVIVSENNLNKHISLLRKVLGARADGQSYIETLPKRGYRFNPDSQANGYSIFSSAANHQGLAVLPFKLLGFGEEEAFWGLGITDALITKLGKLKPLTVRPLSNVLQYQTLADDQLVIGRALDVKYLLDGCLQKAGNQIRASIHLLAIDSGQTLYTDVLEGDRHNIFALQDAIIEQVIEVLTPQLPRQKRTELFSHHTANLQAYNAYMAGRYFWTGVTVDFLNLGRKHFDQALALDPDFALAHCGLADYYVLMSWQGHLSPHQAIPPAKAAALKALELDDTLAQAHTSLGLIQLTYDFDWVNAEQSLHRAIELNASEDMAYFWLATLCIATSRFAEAAAYVQAANQLSPLSPLIRSLQIILEYYSREFEKAEATATEVLSLIPNFPVPSLLLGLAQTAHGKYQQAIAGLEQAATLTGRMISILSALACAHARAGNASNAQAIIVEMQERMDREYVQPGFVAVIYAALDDKEQAFAWLQRAFEERHGFLLYLNVEPAFDPIRTDARFTELLNCMGPMK